LKAAGLRRVNISLDTLDPERFRWLTRGGRLEEVLEGIEAAWAMGLRPIKLNTVVVKGLNDDELSQLARFALERGLIIRFIELMPIGEARASGLAPADLEALRARLAEELELELEPEPAGSPPGSGPARYFRPRGGKGLVGFITPLSREYCRSCNRLRLTADGRLRPCLAHDAEISLKKALREGGGPEEIKGLLRQAVMSKPAGHKWAEGGVTASIMAALGG